MAKKRDLELNEAMSALGFGKFQLMMFCLLFPVTIFHGARMTSSYFFMMDEDHRCTIPGLHNDTYEISAETQQILYNMSIPPDDNCHVYDSVHHNFTYNEHHQPVNASNYTISCPAGSVYKQDILTRNAVSQLHLVCGRSLLKPHGTMLLYMGSLLGAAALGAFADRFGRKKCLLLSVSIFLPCGLGLPWAHHFATLGVLQFLLGAFSTGMFASAFVTGLELVEPKKRKIPGLVTQMFFTLGEFLLAASFYGLRDWRWVSIIITLPTAIFLFYYWVVPESLRWLMIHKKYDDLSAWLIKIAEKNGKVVPRVGYCGDQDDVAKLLESYEADDSFTTVLKGKDSFFDLFKSPVLCRRALTIFFNWLVINMIFYGFTLNSANLKAGSKYVTFCISAAVEIPAHLLTLTFVDKLGRKPVHCALLLLAAVASAGAVGVAIACDGDHQWVVTLLSMLGKLGAAGLMGTSFLWMTELFPTSIRGTGLGFSSSCARAGAILAPYIVDYGKHIQPHNMGTAMPFMVFGVASLLAFLFDLWLPETNAKDLPETIEEAKEFGREPDNNAPLLVNREDNNYGTIDCH